jgi:hypothetical protein
MVRLYNTTSGNTDVGGRPCGATPYIDRDHPIRLWATAILPRNNLRFWPNIDRGILVARDHRRICKGLTPAEHSA